MLAAKHLKEGHIQRIVEQVSLEDQSSRLGDEATSFGNHDSAMTFGN